jgi:hypothetical protein
MVMAVELDEDIGPVQNTLDTMGGKPISQGASGR